MEGFSSSPRSSLSPGGQPLIGATGLFSPTWAYLVGCFSPAISIPAFTSRVPTLVQIEESASPVASNPILMDPSPAFLA